MHYIYIYALRDAQRAKRNAPSATRQAQRAKRTAQSALRKAQSAKRTAQSAATCAAFEERDRTPYSDDTKLSALRKLTRHSAGPNRWTKALDQSARPKRWTKTLQCSTKCSVVAALATASQPRRHSHGVRAMASQPWRQGRGVRSSWAAAACPFNSAYQRAVRPRESGASASTLAAKRTCNARVNP
jgi:hypothetical protein